MTAHHRPRRRSSVTSLLAHQDSKKHSQASHLPHPTTHSHASNYADRHSIKLFQKLVGIVALSLSLVLIFVTIYVLRKERTPLYYSASSLEEIYEFGQCTKEVVVEVNVTRIVLPPSVKVPKALVKKLHMNPYTNTTRPTHNPVKGAIVGLVRNKELKGMLSSIRYHMNAVNSKFLYPYIFLNDQPFTEDFKRRISEATYPAHAEFHQIPVEHWSYPHWIDQEKARESREDLKKRGVVYGGSESYRHMCRYNSGFFYLHPALDDFEYYWRIEPDIRYYCEIFYDPFLFMKSSKKRYSYTISLTEFMETIPTLWNTTRSYINEQRKGFIPHHFTPFLEDENTYNGLHFWSNFEIGDLNFFRDDEYQSYFKHLDESGGFFYERWGDAPVHTLAVALFLDPSEVHLFTDMGYYHEPNLNCPNHDGVQSTFLSDGTLSKCSCDPEIPMKGVVHVHKDVVNSAYVQYVKSEFEKRREGERKAYRKEERERLMKEYAMVENAKLKNMVGQKHL
ncbi:hypothetical protein HDV05_002521 [Chytridiales sp. JEL 0842]|nr:hypothetical protein HDV05_002521 [Chytridiales sp. JEL 0842]